MPEIAAAAAGSGTSKMINTPGPSAGVLYIEISLPPAFDQFFARLVAKCRWIFHYRVESLWSILSREAEMHRDFPPVGSNPRTLYQRPSRVSRLAGSRSLRGYTYRLRSLPIWLLCGFQSDYRDTKSDSSAKLTASRRVGKLAAVRGSGWFGLATQTYHHVDANDFVSLRGTGALRRTSDVGTSTSSC